MSSSPVDYSSKCVMFPARPGYGIVGRKCLIKANHFTLQLVTTIHNYKGLYHYHVWISPQVTSMKLNRDIVKELGTLNYLGNVRVAYDGRNTIYSVGELPFSSNEFILKFPTTKTTTTTSECEFKVSIRFVSRIDLCNPQSFLHTIQPLNVALRSAPSEMYSVVGRSFYHDTMSRAGELGDGVMYWKGFYQSLRPTQLGLSLNIDVSAKAFYEPIEVTDFIFKNFNVRYNSTPLDDHVRVQLRKNLRGVKVTCRHLDDTMLFKVFGVSTEPLNNLMFDLDGNTISVVTYFQDKYEIQLEYVTWPALQVGSATKPIYLPIEVCRIVERQRCCKKLNQRQVTNLLRETCQRPYEREETIRQIFRQNNYNDQNLVRDFGINVANDMTLINARVLPPPLLLYHDTGNEATANPQLGQWNMINKKMINGGHVKSWTCVNFSHENPNIHNRFCDELVNMCISRGMAFQTAPVIPSRAWPANEIEEALKYVHDQCNMILGNKQLQLLIIILPDFSGSYGTIKRVCETELGIVSQCCRPKHAAKLNNKQYLENLSLKINTKVGGRNTVLSDALNKRIPFVSDVPTIIFGAAFTHPKPEDYSSPSIAAVVASMDWPEVTKYRALVSAQQHTEEIIQDLYKVTTDDKGSIVHGGMIRDHLIAFSRSTGAKPHRIIFYRDGVSDGQFNRVLLYEMDAIRKGTSRPAHYHVLFDENNFTADALQVLTNNLCYTYARCTKSVSIVPPAYYAHLAAIRARCYIGVAVDEEETDVGPRTYQPLQVINGNLKDVMFYV
ncbi:hypothetical protein G4B88_015474 [Cannabis sativa]|uniref:Uncharacterized protein n=1 Tax=Cannabis sativa TaxID=3483 RepID=A0A7J6DL96_CANSA|nr:hypothetical protein G4B88_015474 [Cannabis sativa]